MWGISYWIFPVIAGSCWLSMLLGLLLHWISSGRPHYVSMNSSQKIAYISDIGADSLKPLFIAGCAATTVFLNLSFFSERLLRHNGRLIRNTSTFQKILVWLSIIFSCMGSVGLIMLSIYDTISHPEIHDIFLALFISGYIISAFMICCEYQRLSYRM
ncbi:unnamed protein product [Blumeria hordei]|uniref:CWH43-like N-terminal domain-containing protein n=1 Tax=Blumeria hordei TaxID=2867405 RepID=A0A383UXS6_BLUHO|nr:unnamed protein product [Blumeria hordei]